MIRLACVPALLSLTLAAAGVRSAMCQSADPAQAPLPIAITSAHTLFLGNAGDQENADCLRAYNDLYADLTKLNRFRLVPDPRSANLILEMHYELTPGQTAGHDDPRRFRVLLIEPQSHIVLWSLTERTNYASLQRNRDKNLDEMVARLASDFDALTTAQPPNNNSRTTHGLLNH